MSHTRSQVEFREQVLRAVAVLALQGRPITQPNLRAAGATGGNDRLMQTAAELVREGQISLDHWNLGRDLRTMIGRAEVQASLDAAEREHAAREQSAEWVAEHDARMRRILRHARGARRTRSYIDDLPRGMRAQRRADPQTLLE